MEKKSEKHTNFNIFENPNISERKKYKYYLSIDTQAFELKKKAKRIVAERGLSLIMNDSKWLKLQSSIEKLPFPPPYIEKSIFEDISFEELQISKAPEWLGNWNPFYKEGMSLFFTIEYIKVKPRYAEYEGQLVSPKIFDETKAFELLLKELNIPYEDENGTFIIFGYK